MIAAYLRVSSIGQSLASQEAEIRRWLPDRSAKKIKVQWYIDEAQSGKSLDRPAFARLDADVALGKVDTIVVYKLDRLSRNVLDGLATLSRWLDAGVRFVATSQNFDFRGAVGKMIAALLLGIAEMERETLLERQRAGIDAARAAGKRWGGSKPGPRFDVGRMEELRQAGLRQREIAAAMGVSERTVARHVGQRLPAT